MQLDQPITDLMTADPRTVGVDDSLTDVQTFMLNGGFHHVPVVEGEAVVGILSTTDTMAVLRDLPEELEDTGVVLDESRSIRTLMTDDVATLSSGATVRDAVQHFATGRYHALPVVDDGVLVGIVTTTDLMAAWLAEG